MGNMSKHYPSSLTDEQWEKIAAYFSPADPRGRKAIHSKKEIVDAILYVLKGGIQWRMLPLDFPPWKTVYDHFSRWNKRGVWAKVLNVLNRRNYSVHL
jgi:putative transposase